MPKTFPKTNLRGKKDVLFFSSGNLTPEQKSRHDKHRKKLAEMRARRPATTARNYPTRTNNANTKLRDGGRFVSLSPDFNYEYQLFYFYTKKINPTIIEKITTVIEKFNEINPKNAIKSEIQVDTTGQVKIFLIALDENDKTASKTNGQTFFEFLTTFKEIKLAAIAKLKDVLNDSKESKQTKETHHDKPYEDETETKIIKDNSRKIIFTFDTFVKKVFGFPDKTMSSLNENLEIKDDESSDPRFLFEVLVDKIRPSSSSQNSLKEICEELNLFDETHTSQRKTKKIQQIYQAIFNHENFLSTLKNLEEEEMDDFLLGALHSNDVPFVEQLIIHELLTDDHIHDLLTARDEIDTEEQREILQLILEELPNSVYKHQIETILDVPIDEEDENSDEDSEADSTLKLRDKSQPDTAPTPTSISSSQATLSTLASNTASSSEATPTVPPIPLPSGTSSTIHPQPETGLSASAPTLPITSTSSELFLEVIPVLIPIPTTNSFPTTPPLSSIGLGLSTVSTPPPPASLSSSSSSGTGSLGDIASSQATTMFFHNISNPPSLRELAAASNTGNDNSNPTDTDQSDAVPMDENDEHYPFLSNNI